LIEFAIILPVLVLLLLGMSGYTLSIHGAMQLQAAAAAGAAFGAIPGNEANLSGMQAVAANAAAGISGFTAAASTLWACSAGGPAVASTSTCSSGVTPYKFVIVKTSGSAPFALNYPGISSKRTLYGSATFQVPWSQ